MITTFFDYLLDKPIKRQPAWCLFEAPLLLKCALWDDSLLRELAKSQPFFRRSTTRVEQFITQIDEKLVKARELIDKKEFAPAKALLAPYESFGVGLFSLEQMTAQNKLIDTFRRNWGMGRSFAATPINVDCVHLLIWHEREPDA